MFTSNFNDTSNVGLQERYLNDGNIRYLEDGNSLRSFGGVRNVKEPRTTKTEHFWSVVQN